MTSIGYTRVSSDDQSLEAIEFVGAVSKKRIMKSW